MHRLIATALCALFLFSTGSFAAERERLGYGRLITNDLIGDGRDRWRTGSAASSRVWGPAWNGSLPGRFGDIIELRFNAEILAPENVTIPAAGDRPYAGAISVGLHTHYMVNQTEISVGGDLVFTGPQTGLNDFQSLIHDTIGGNDVSSGTRATQIGDDINPTLVLEFGRTVQMGQSARIRPFLEGRAGIETLLRVGADFTLGQVGQGELLVRDPVTGYRYRTIRNSIPGFSLVVGGDIAYVSDSEFLPSNQGFKLTDARSRARAGVHWQTKQGHRFFYGLTWMDKEFKGQRDSQIVGSLRLNVEF